ncbi:FxsA family protein [Paenibacillus sp. J2TS4]|uniref:FxsA family protein n=1 Tax=Paenibacillus sp. J2TS4 TaxID=2807194 RepID=UPI001B0DF7D9|nr:FxsA family protein [Paenibacillus sp. J2TS4]GIP33704.1 UPF0716 protein YtzA [Paenibacillus sp. J2TS4]
MFKWLILLLITVPALEIWGIIAVGSWIGGWQTFLLIVLTGLIGAYLAKSEGRKVWEYAQQQMALGYSPTASLLDGIIVFAGGVFLLAPGFITDIVGLVLLLPFTRPVVKRWLYLWIERQIQKGRFLFFTRR